MTSLVTRSTVTRNVGFCPNWSVFGGTPWGACEGDPGA